MLVVGEQTRLTVQIENANVIDWPDAPKVTPLALTRLGKNRVIINRHLKDVFEYAVTSFQVGTFTIPPFELRTAQGIVRSKAISIKVSPISALATKGISIRPDTVPYLSGIFLEKVSPFVGETQLVEAKLYLANRQPHHLKLYDGQVIKMEKKGLAAWRFTTEGRQASGVLNHDGIRFLVYTYRSSLNALQDGKLSIGPGKVEPVFEMRTTVRGGFRTLAKTFPIEFPKADLHVRPLPLPSPAGFAGAVGNFSMEALPSTTNLKVGEAITIKARVSGDGNLDQFPGPQLLDPKEQWKQFGMISKPPGSERRSSSGTVEFSQVIRPKTKLNTLPPYRFIFFDPVLERYRTLDSPERSLVMKGETPSSAAENSHLTFLTPTHSGLKPIGQKVSLSPYWWHLVPAGIFLYLLVSALRTRLKAHALSNLPLQEFNNALQKIREKSNDQVAFYRESANFVTQWKGKNGFEEIFSRRDEICFRADAPRMAVPETEKNRILNRLQSLAPLLIAGFFLLQLGQAHGQQEDPVKERLRILVELKNRPAPEHFYNLALCEKALGRPAQAVLWAYRYEAQGGEASTLLEELPGIKAREKEGLDWLSYFSLSLYQHLTFAGIWATAIFSTCLILRHSNPRPFLTGLSGVSALFFLLIGGGAWMFYPKDISFEPLHHLAVVTSEKVVLRSQPYLGGSSLRENIAGSLCKIQAERAGWVKLKLPGRLQGWAQKDFIESISLDLASLDLPER